MLNIDLVEIKKRQNRSIQTRKHHFVDILDKCKSYVKRQETGNAEYQYKESELQKLSTERYRNKEETNQPEPSQIRWPLFKNTGGERQSDTFIKSKKITPVFQQSIQKTGAGPKD